MHCGKSVLWSYVFIHKYSALLIIICELRNKGCWCFTAFSVHFSWKLQWFLCIGTCLEIVWVYVKKNRSL